MFNGCLIVVSVGRHTAGAHGVAGVGVAVRGYVKRKIRGGFGALDIAEPFNGIVIEALAALMAHVLGQTVDHKSKKGGVKLDIRYGAKEAAKAGVKAEDGAYLLTIGKKGDRKSTRLNSSHLA